MKLAHSNHSLQASGRRGHAMLLAITLMTTLMILSYAFFRPTASAQKEVRSKMDDQRAFALAEAGLNESLEALRQGQSGGIGTVNTPAVLGGGIVWVTVTDLGPNPLGNNLHQLVSTAAVGSGRQALSAVFEVDADNDPLFVATLNSKEKLTLNADVLIDSFDSETGTYLSQMTNVKGIHKYANDNGDVRSNQDIELNARAADFGDATPGPGYAVTMATGAFVTGSTTPSSQPFAFPTITFPTYPVGPSYSLANNGTATIPSGNHAMSSLKIGKGATLTVQGPAEIVLDDFTGGKDAKLLIDATNGPVTFYVRNSYTHISGFEADAVPGSPMAMAFLIDSPDDLVFPSATSIRGAYYLPNADIVFSSANECWGSFAANRIAMSNDMKFHFDESLAKHWNTNTGANDGTLTLLSWEETIVSVPDLLTDRRDPLLVLGLQNAALASPFDSWIEKLQKGTTP